MNNKMSRNSKRGRQKQSTLAFLRNVWGLGGVIITDRLCVVSSAHTTQTSSYLYLFFGEHLLQSVHNDQAVGALNGGRALTETQKNKTDLFLP